MSNKVYLTPGVKETLQSSNLSEADLQKLDTAMTSLSHDAAQKSPIVLQDKGANDGLRVLKQNDMRIFFRYDPSSSTVVVADIQAKAEPAAIKLRAQEEMVTA